MVMNFINEENLFYYIYESAFKKFQQDTSLVQQVVKGLFEKLDDSYSFKKNKAILPYQRVISLGLFCLCKGEIKELSIEFLMENLSLSK